MDPSCYVIDSVSNFPACVLYILSMMGEHLFARIAKLWQHAIREREALSDFTLAGGQGPIIQLISTKYLPVNLQPHWVYDYSFTGCFLEIYFDCF